MEPISDIEHATAVAGSVCAGLDAVRGSAFWKIDEDGLLTLAGVLERVGRLVYAAQGPPDRGTGHPLGLRGPRRLLDGRVAAADAVHLPR